MSKDKANPPIHPKDELSNEELDKVTGGAPNHPGGTEAGRPEISEISISKRTDISSTKLLD